MEEKEGNEISTKRSEVIQIVFLVLIFLAICSLIFATVTIVRFKNQIMRPLQYNLERFDVDSCMCQKNDGSQFFVEALNKKRADINFSEIS